MDMAPKKKNEIDEEKERLAKDAQEVRAAADKLKVPTGDTHFGSTWDRTRQEVDELDKEFGQESIVNKLRRKFGEGNVDVRVLQVGPDGRLTDVSEKVNPRDIRADQIKELRADGIPLSRSPRTAEAALEALQQMLPGIKSGPKNYGGSTAESIRRMEIVLAESDKILEHWKK
jgi:hypothetical protein